MNLEKKTEKIEIQREFQVKTGVALLKKDRAFTTNLQFFPCPDNLAIELTKDATGRQLYKNPIWSYDLGRISITLLGQPDIGLPFGIISRLIINWIDNEIVYNTKKSSTREETLSNIKGGYKIYWSDSVSDFCVNSLGMSKSSAILKEIQKQFEKISSMTFRTKVNDSGKYEAYEIPFVVEKNFKWDKGDGKLIPGNDSSWIVIHPVYVKYVIERNFYVEPEIMKLFLRNAEGIDLYKYFKYIQTTQKAATEISFSEIKEKIGWTGRTDSLTRKIGKIINEIMLHDKSLKIEIKSGENRFKEPMIIVHVLKGANLFAL